jgi:integrase
VADTPEKSTERGTESSASVISPPKAEGEEVETLSEGEVAATLHKRQGHDLHAIVAVAPGTGMRRGELLAARWMTATWTAPPCGLSGAWKRPSTVCGSRRGRRTISLPPSVVMVLREHRRKTMDSVCRPLERRARSLRRKPQIPIADQAAALPLGVATKCLEFDSELGDLSRFVCVAHQAW